MKKLVLLAVTLVMVLSLCLPAGAEPAAEVTKYGNIGRLSKLNITEDQLNDVLKDIMVNSICNRYVFYDTMTDMLMALQRGDSPDSTRPYWLRSANGCKRTSNWYRSTASDEPWLWPKAR